MKNQIIEDTQLMRKTELSPLELEKYQKAIEHFDLKIKDDTGSLVANPYTLNYERELIYCYEHNESVLDFFAWVEIERLINEKVSFEEYNQLLIHPETMNKLNIDVYASNQRDLLICLMKNKLKRIRGTEVTSILRLGGNLNG